MEQNTERKSIFDTEWNENSVESNVDSYRKISVFAIISFILAITAQLAYIHPGFIFLSVLGILAAFVAIGSIRSSEGTLFGIAMAKTALALCIIPIGFNIAYWPYHNYILRTQAREFADIWTDAIRNRNVPLALEMRKPYWNRNLPEDQIEWWKSKIDDSSAHSNLHYMMKRPMLKTLLLLGDKAEYSYMQTVVIRNYEGQDYVTMVYAVSYTKDDGAKEFFPIVIKVNRSKNPLDNTRAWNIENIPETIETKNFVKLKLQ